MEEQGKLLSLESAAIQTELSAATIRKMIKRGELPAIRLSHNILRIRQSDLDAYIQSRQIAAK